MLSKTIIIGTAHSFRTVGKCSPDGRVREHEWRDWAGGVAKTVSNN